MNKTRSIPDKRTLATKGEMTLFLDGKNVYLISDLDLTGRFVCSLADFDRSKRNIVKEGWRLV